MEDDKLEVTHLMGKKLDKPIILKWKSETKKNKMEQVAQLFGKKLDEEFKLEITFFSMRKIFTVKFTKNGLEYLTKYNAWEQRNCYIPYLLTGKAVVVND